MPADYWWENPPPFERMSHDWPCPTVLAFSDGRRYTCTLTVRASRTKHAVAHKWAQQPQDDQESKETTNA